MATINASLTLSSGDLLTSNLAFSVASTLTTAGTQATGLSKTTGLARTNFTNDPIQSKTLYRSDDALTNGSNKVYLKNLSTTATEFFTIYIDQEEMGRLYAGDWAFFPWAATSGTKETFTVTIAATWAAADTWEFDGITTIAANSTVADIAAQIHAQNYPNWTTSISTAVVTFTARRAVQDGVITGDTAITGDVLDTAGNGSAAIAGGTAGAGSRSESDIIVVPSVATTMVLEHMLFNE